MDCWEDPGPSSCCCWTKKWLGTFSPVLGDVLVLGTLKQLRGGLIYLTASGGKRFCARRGLFPADDELQRKKSI